MVYTRDQKCSRENGRFCKCNHPNYNSAFTFGFRLSSNAIFTISSQCSGSHFSDLHDTQRATSEEAYSN